MEEMTGVEEEKFDQGQIEQTATRLKNKYEKKRKVNELKLMKPVNKFKRFLSIFTSVLVVIMFVYSLIYCVSTFANRLNNTAPTFWGYTYTYVKTGSMSQDTITIDGVEYPSGHPAKTNVMVHAVDTSTLKVGDKIAFYVDTSSFAEFYSSDVGKVVNQNTQTKKICKWYQAFGFQSNLIRQSAKKRCDIVFHHICEIYEDENGTRWFRTYGSNNPIPDYWIVKDVYVVGIYDNSATAQVFSSVLYFFTSKSGMFVAILIPLILLIVLIIWDAAKNLAITKLELDCVEEKRKITDPICVKNNVGFKMSPKTKRKILVQASDDEKSQYISLLWKKGTAPNSVKKYAVRRSILLEPTRRLLEVNRKCSQMFKDGVDPEQIATYYLTEKDKIEEQEKRIRQKVKAITRAYSKK